MSLLSSFGSSKSTLHHLALCSLPGSCLVWIMSAGSRAPPEDLTTQLSFWVPITALSLSPLGLGVLTAPLVHHCGTSLS